MLHFHGIPKGKRKHEPKNGKITTNKIGFKNCTLLQQYFQIVNFVLVHCFHLVEQCRNITIITVNIVILSSKFAIWILVHQICATLKRLNTIQPFSIPHRLRMFTISFFILNSEQVLSFPSENFLRYSFLTLALFLVFLF